MDLRNVGAAVIFAAALLWPVSAHTANEALVIELDATSASVRGATPRGEVLFFGVANEAGGYYTGLIRYDGVVSADERGAARYTPPVGMHPRAVWFAIDLTSATYSVAAPKGFPLRPLRTAPELVRKGTAASDVDSIVSGFFVSEFVLARRGGFVWRSSTVRSSSEQEDSSPRLTRLRTDKLTNKSGRNPGGGPDKLRPGDLIIVVDPHTLAYTTQTVQ